MTPKATLAVSLVTGLLLAGCHAGDQQEATRKAQAQARDDFARIAKDVAQTTQTYHAMSNDDLVARLIEQSKLQQEPFNSLAYRELSGRTNVNSEGLAEIVRNGKDGDTLLPLLLLRHLDEKAYRDVPVGVRARILANALQRSKTFNTWGIPNLYLEDASLALLECGRAIAPELRRMLGETRPAPVFGSKAAMYVKQYQLRLCDYALFYLRRLAGRADFTLPKSVAERDSLIERLRGEAPP
jgi:hypothetical protein